MKNQFAPSSKILFSAFVALAISVACAKKDDKKDVAPAPPSAPTTPETQPTVPSVDPNGACTSQFLDAYRAVDATMKNTNRDGGKEEAEKACDSFFANHSAVICKMKSTVTGEEGFLESKTFAEACGEIKRSLGRPDESAGPGGAPVVDDDATEILSVDATKISMKVLNAAKVKTSMSNTKVYFVNGRIGPIEAFNDEIQAGASRCMFIDTRRKYIDTITSGGSHPVLRTLDYVHESGNNITTRMVMLSFAEDNFGLGCLKLSTQPTKLGEIRAALRGIVDIAVAR